VAQPVNPATHPAPDAPPCSDRRHRRPSPPQSARPLSSASPGSAPVGRGKGPADTGSCEQGDSANSVRIMRPPSRWRRSTTSPESLIYATNLMGPIRPSATPVSLAPFQWPDQPAVHGNANHSVDQPSRWCHVPVTNDVKDRRLRAAA
jgi:hypothetical protein